jgi:hypothetical protein
MLLQATGTLDSQAMTRSVAQGDAGGASMWFAPIAALYFSRKWQQAQSDAKTKLGVNIPNAITDTEEDK